MREIFIILKKLNDRVREIKKSELVNEDILLNEIESFRNIIINTVLNKDQEEKEENIEIVGTFAYAGINRPIIYVKEQNMYYIESEIFGNVADRSIEKVKEGFKQLIREKQLMDSEEAKENKALA